MSTSYSWEGKGRYGSSSAVMIHYEEALYQVYAPLLVASFPLQEVYTLRRLVNISSFM